MILEGIVTTISAAGALNIAPMGPQVDPAMENLLLRPFQTAQTFCNLKDHPEGVFHVTDDVLLLARAAVGPVIPQPSVHPARTVRGYVLEDCCRYYEFRVVSADHSDMRARFQAKVIHCARVRDFVGFNRAKHAVVEAAILATRLFLLPLPEIEVEFRRLHVIVDKTGGPREIEAFRFLENYVAGKALAANAGAQAATAREPVRSDENTEAQP
jgi:hypothetical protein